MAPAGGAVLSNAFFWAIGGGGGGSGGITLAQATAAAQAVVATNIPASSLYSSNSAQLGGNLPSYYAAASNTVPVTVDSNGVYTVIGTNAPFAYPGTVGIGIPVNAVYVTSGRSAYNNQWFTNANTIPQSWVSPSSASRYITNINGVFVIGGGASGSFGGTTGGAATNGSLFGFYAVGGFGGSGNIGDATSTNTFVYPFPILASGFYLPNNTNPPPPLSAIPAGGCFIQCSNSEVWFIFNTNSTEVGVHFP